MPLGKPETIKYFGIIYDRYTPQVEGQILRDCLMLQEVARKTSYDQVTIVCTSDDFDHLLDVLGMERTSDTTKTREWLVYKTGEQWPQPPGDVETVVERDMEQKRKAPNMQVLDGLHNNGYYLPPQGRLSPDTISLLRPAPNGYAPINTGFFLLFN